MLRYESDSDFRADEFGSERRFILVSTHTQSLFDYLFAALAIAYENFQPSSIQRIFTIYYLQIAGF